MHFSLLSIWNAGPDNYFSKVTWCMRPIADATSGQDASSSFSAVIGGAIGGVIVGVPLLIVIVLLCSLLVCMRRRSEKTGMWSSVYYRST